ncbi:MAG: DNA-binding response regulator [Salinisphaeraceae bacterium]|jgi:DNA-binding NarL/FixJ family response regulator|nr:DNA-binding response regulator [Salinisphaeraceae bacterium]
MAERRGPRLALVVEDLPTSREWLQELLAEAFPDIRVHAVETLEQGRLALASINPELALVDLGLPDGSGVDLIEQARREGRHCKCVVTTIYADDAHLFPALRAGAAGYLLKDQPAARLVAQLQRIHGGEPPLSPVIARRLLRMFEPDAAQQAAEQLSPRETETLLLIAKGYRLNEVADSMGVTRNTAAGYIKNVYRKLEISSRAEAALAASRMGLVRLDL